MKCSVFIASSVDGYIATSDGGVDWLDSTGKADAPMGADADMGFEDFIASVDCLIMGRNTLEKLSSFELEPEQWPYGDLPILALSLTRNKAPGNLEGMVEMVNSEILDLVTRLESDGFQHAYIDGGATITSFLNRGLINEMTITYAPVLLGEGIPLFGKLSRPVKLKNIRTVTYPNEFFQIKYEVGYR